MSGPVSAADAVPEGAGDGPHPCELETIEGRTAQVGAFDVRRVLPRRARRTVGAWCFVDHMGPGAVSREQGLDIGPHPHIGLQTVTWLLQGEVLHRDSLGTEQLIRPGQLNVMTAGHGVSHSEETRGIHEGALHGVQLWVAQPASTREGAPAFEHHAELPRVALANGDATVLIGDLSDVESPARRDSDNLGLDLELRTGVANLALTPTHEHALVVLDGSVSVGGRQLGPGKLGYLGTGRDELVLDVPSNARLLIIGGEPFPDPLLMWWNYVARTREEVVAAHRSWVDDDGRFGSVDSPLDRIVIDGPPWE